MTKTKNIASSITLQEPMRISMECLPLRVFNEGLYSDLLIGAVLVSRGCEEGRGKHIDELKDCCDRKHSQWFY